MNYFRLALKEFQDIVGHDHAYIPRPDREKWECNSTGLSRMPLAIVSPANVEEVISVVKLAEKYVLPLYPISTGHNWGYGTATATANSCVIVRLDRMDKIKHFDESTATVLVEPGVTQQALRDYLDKNKLPYIVPTTGAGPRCSLIGNALERGFGITPVCDHFASVMGLTAVLPDGSVYRSHHLPGFKWGIGPYLDGIFSQHGLGIITEMSIALAPEPEAFLAFVVNIPHNDYLGDVTHRVHHALSILGENIRGINVMNALRVIALSQRCPQPYLETGNAIPAEMISKLAQHIGVGAWTAIGTIGGTKKVVSAVKSEVQRIFSKEYAVRFLSPSRARTMPYFIRLMSWIGSSVRQNYVNQVPELMNILSGRPSSIALQLVRWRSTSIESTSEPIDPDKSDRGLLWYSPIVPQEAAAISAFERFVTETCREHQLDPLITFTAHNNRFFGCTVPLLFRRNIERDLDMAHHCYKKLMQQGEASGFRPYRVGIQGMADLIERDASFWKLQAKIKEALDPKGIISPGRYSLSRFQ